MNRRGFLKGLAAVGAGLILPPTLEENAAEAKRFWALDSTMVRPPLLVSMDPGWDDGKYALWLEGPRPNTYYQVFPCQSYASRLKITGIGHFTS